MSNDRTPAELADKSDEHLERLRNQLALDPNPQAKVQLPRVIAEQQRRRREGR